jgi:transcriptional regulator with XRE-family HTH domain
MEVGSLIKEARLAKGLTQEELGKLVGVQKSAIAKYENG